MPGAVSALRTLTLRAPVSRTMEASAPRGCGKPPAALAACASPSAPSSPPHGAGQLLWLRFPPACQRQLWGRATEPRSCQGAEAAPSQVSALEHAEQRGFEPRSVDGDPSQGPSGRGHLSIHVACWETQRSGTPLGVKGREMLTLPLFCALLVVRACRKGRSGSCSGVQSEAPRPPALAPHTDGGTRTSFLGTPSLPRHWAGAAIVRDGGEARARGARIATRPAAGKALTVRSPYGSTCG